MVEKICGCYDIGWKKQDSAKSDKDIKDADIIKNLKKTLQKKLLKVDATLLLVKGVKINKKNVMIKIEKNILTQIFYKVWTVKLKSTADGYELENF